MKIMKEEEIKIIQEVLLSMIYWLYNASTMSKAESERLGELLNQLSSPKPKGDE